MNRLRNRFEPWSPITFLYRTLRRANCDQLTVYLARQGRIGGFNLITWAKRPRSSCNVMSEAMPTREPSLQPQAPKFLTRIPVVGEDLAREWPQIRAIRYTIVLVVVATVLL